MGPPLRPGSAARAWLVGHDGFQVVGAIVVVGLGISVYASARVPSPYGGPIPMWFLTPPALAMLSGLAVRNAIDDVGWWSGRRRPARLVWASFLVMVTGLAAALVGSSAGQHRLPELTMLLTAGTFGLATVLGRGSASLGAGCLVLVVGSTRELHTMTPADLWDRLEVPGQVVCSALAVLCVVGYSALGPRRSRAAPVG